MDAVMFPGQGSQRAGMGAPWVDTPSWAVVADVSDALGRDVGSLLLAADAPTLQATRNAQIASFALGLVGLDAARRAGVRWDIAVGHSLGEYTALVAAGALTHVDAAKLVGERAEAMQEAADASPGTMAAVLGLEPDDVAACCDAAGGEAWPANDNAPGQIVVAGTPDGVRRAGDAARPMGGKVLPLAVGGAFHTPLMAAAQARVDRALAAAPFGETTTPVIANVDAEPHRAPEDWAGLLSLQLCLPVRWREIILRMEEMGVTRVIELGPGGILAGMVKRTAPGLARVAIAAPADLEGWA